MFVVTWKKKLKINYIGQCKFYIVGGYDSCMHLISCKEQERIIVTLNYFGTWYNATKFLVLAYADVQSTNIAQVVQIFQI